MPALLHVLVVWEIDHLNLLASISLSITIHIRTMAINRFGCALTLFVLTSLMFVAIMLLQELSRGFYVKNRYEVVDIDLLKVPSSAASDSLLDCLAIAFPAAADTQVYLGLNVLCRIFSDSTEGTHKSLGTFRCCYGGIRDSIYSIQWLRHPLADCSPALHGAELAKQSRDSAILMAAPHQQTFWESAKYPNVVGTNSIPREINHSRLSLTIEEFGHLEFYPSTDQFSWRAIERQEHIGIRFHFQSGRQLSAWLDAASPNTQK